MDNSLALSIHRALFCAIPKNLKGLRVVIEENNKLIWQAFFDAKPTEEEKEVLSIASTEVLADYPDIHTIEEEFLYHPAPLNIQAIEEWAFVRWEP
ncbi:hypothetical protein CSV72_04070 [Sporosarcina sp. P20a]|uniref:hypothetical protein n=1 Tax=Sporosarcina sp. P20a TaxID=2048256 RepID=UPI000C166389|nr:hypothetical protein [Sporosarcina sp. P20a]PIC87160.1 hypothetical protein CSV72_04070 [Sporosarcina sp. P20a]